MIDFSIPPELEATRQSVIAFMDQYVYPNEKELVEDEGLPADLESELQKRVKAQSQRLGRRACPRSSDRE